MEHCGPPASNLNSSPTSRNNRRAGANVGDWRANCTTRFRKPCSALACTAAQRASCSCAPQIG